jgi:gliding motility-associated-like protein
MASDDLGCVGMEQVKVNIVPIEVDVDEDLLVCLGESETIEVTNLNPDQRLRFSWEPANFIVRGGNTDSPTVNPTTNTTFTATIENQYGCETTVSVPVEVFDFGVIITATATPDSILPGGTSQLFATLGNTYGYVWSPGGTLSNTTIHNPLASPDFTTTYSVTVTDTRTGCIAVRDVTVVVFDPVCEDPNIFIPNAFSPNDDDNNDVLYVYGQFVEEMHLEIYNRWGQKVFDSDSQTVGWDGTFKGEPLSPDVYGYHLTVKCINGEEYFKKGNVTLMR